MKATDKKTRDNTIDARKAMRRRRRRRLLIIRAAVVISVMLVLLLVVALLVLRGVGVAAAKRGETTSFLAVKAIQVEGESRYSDEEIVEKSGLYVGQSLLAVNKARSHEDLLAAFPYLARVEISNASFDTVLIRVEETQVMGAVTLEDGYMVLGENNHALERLAEEELPAGILRIQGATLQQEAIGRPLLDQRSLGVCTTLVQAANAAGVEGLTALDITKKTNVQLWWKNQVRIVLGNENNIPTQMKAFGDLLPTLLKNNGDTVSGRLDMTSYADEDAGNDKAIFTPAELLVEATPDETPDVTEGTTTDTVTATTTTTTA